MLKPALVGVAKAVKREAVAMTEAGIEQFGAATKREKSLPQAPRELSQTDLKGFYGDAPPLSSENLSQIKKNDEMRLAKIRQEMHGTHHSEQVREIFNPSQERPDESQVEMRDEEEKKREVISFQERKSKTLSRGQKQQQGSAELGKVA